MTFFEYYLFVGIIYSVLNFIYTIIVLYKYKLNIFILSFLISSILIIFVWPIHLYYVIHIIFDENLRKELSDQYQQNIDNKDQ